MTRQSLTAAAIAFATLFGAAGLAHAANLSQQDEHFLRQAAQGGEYELAISRLAAQRASSEQLKAYAQQVISDHLQMNTRLQRLAQNNGLTLPNGMTNAQQAEVSDLRQLRGAAFDRAYLQDMAQVNSRDRQDEQQAMAATQNPTLQSLARQLQASDQRHQQEARKIRQG